MTSEPDAVLAQPQQFLLRTMVCDRCRRAVNVQRAVKRRFERNTIFDQDVAAPEAQEQRLRAFLDRTE